MSRELTLAIFTASASVTIRTCSAHSGHQTLISIRARLVTITSCVTVVVWVVRFFLSRTVSCLIADLLLPHPQRGTTMCVASGLLALRV